MTLQLPHCNGEEDMQLKFTGNSIQSTIRLAVQGKHQIESFPQSDQLEEKLRRFDVRAFPLIWTHWIEVWAQFGVAGRNSDTHVSQINVAYGIISTENSSFDVEIKGGDRFIRNIGPGSDRITVTGNVATAVSVRYRSHSLPITIATSVT